MRTKCEAVGGALDKCSGGVFLEFRDPCSRVLKRSKKEPPNGHRKFGNCPVHMRSAFPSSDLLRPFPRVHVFVPRKAPPKGQTRSRKGPTRGQQLLRGWPRPLPELFSTSSDGPRWTFTRPFSMVRRFKTKPPRTLRRAMVMRCSVACKFHAAFADSPRVQVLKVRRSASREMIVARCSSTSLATFPSGTHHNTTTRTNSTNTNTNTTTQGISSVGRQVGNSPCCACRSTPPPAQ